MRLHFIKSSEKRRLVEELELIYGIEKVPYLLLETGKQKLRGFSGSLSKDEIKELSHIIRVEVIGLYLFSKRDEDIRISFDSISLLRDKIKKSTLEITEEQLHKWLRGNDLEIKVPSGIVVIKQKDDLFGIGKSNGEKIFNYVPRERTLKNQS